MALQHLKKIAWQARLALTGNIPARFRELLVAQWFGRRQTAEVQHGLLTRILCHAYRHVPYYREIFTKAGIDPEKGVINTDVIRSIPLLDKDIIRQNHEALKSDDLAGRKWHENTSGGSTGEPVRFVQDKAYHEMSVAVKMLDDLWSGYGAGDRKVLLWGSERDLFEGRDRRRTRAGRWLRNEVALNAFRMTPSQMLDYVSTINSWKPVQILAYAGSIYELSCFIDREKLPVHMPKAIMSSAGVMEAFMRKTIERVFRAPVFDRYGSREVGDIACECDHHRGLHISAPTHYVEVLRAGGAPADAGESGEIVVTSLTNYAMPLIRYRIGDMGALSEEACPCGRGWPLLKKIAGRVTDTFLKEDGTQIHGEFFTHLFYYQDWVKKFQVTQDTFDRIRVAIVQRNGSGRDRGSHGTELEDITKKIHAVMGRQCRVEFAFVDDIAPSPSGKYRYTISNIER